jgi:hypothetical protein
MGTLIFLPVLTGSFTTGIIGVSSTKALLCFGGLPLVLFKGSMLTELVIA